MNRLIVAFALVFSASAYGDVWCDADRIVPAADLASCPDALTNLEAAVGETTVTFTWDNSSADTVYAYAVAGTSIIPPGCPANTTVDERRVCTARLNHAVVAAGTGAAAFGSATASAGTLVLSGLNDDSPYCAVLEMPDDSIGLRAEPRVVCVTTAQTPMGTDDPDIYVSDTGSDLADGLTITTPLRNPSTAESAAAVGDDIGFVAGSVFADTAQTFNVSGTIGNQQINGTVYNDGGVGKWWWEGSAPYTATRAIFDGTYEQACSEATPMSCTFGAGAVPSNVNNALITVAANYTTVRAMHIKDSAGDGFASGGSYKGIQLAQVKFERIAFVAAKMGSGNERSIMALNDGELIAHCEIREEEGGISGNPARNCGSGGKPPCFAMQHNHPNSTPSGGHPLNAIIGNRIHQSACESVNVWNSTGIDIAFNMTSRSGPIYTDTGGPVVVRNNAVAGNPAGVNKRHNKNNGIGISMEGSTPCTGHPTCRYDTADSDVLITIFDNIVTGGDDGIWANSISSTSATNGYRTAAYIYHNTVIGTSDRAAYAAGSGYDVAVLDHDMYANILYSPTALTAQGCSLRATGTRDYNVYPAPPTDADCTNGAGNLSGDPQFPNAISYYEGFQDSDWDTATHTDFTPAWASALEVAPAPTLPSRITDFLTLAGWSDISAQVQYYKSQMASTPGLVDLWPSLNGALPTTIGNVDAFGNARSAPNDIGAKEQ